MKTRFQRLSFAVGLSLMVGALVGKITEQTECYFEGHKVDCGRYSKVAAEEIKYNLPYAIATSFAVFGLCLMINAFVKEDSNKAE
jgi:hypothetical protein